MPPYTAVSHSKRYYIGKDAICQQLLFGFFAVSESFFCLVNQFAQNAVPAEARDAHTAELIMQFSGLGVDLDVIRRVTREETGLRLLEKHGLLRADQRGMERILEFTGHLCSLRRALLLDCVRDLIRHFRGGRAGAARVREDVNFREAAGADKAQRLPEFFVRFAGESDDQVGRDGAAGEIRVQEADALVVARGVVLAVHAAQDAVAAALEAQVELRAEIWEARQRAAECFVDRPRFERAETDAHIRHGGADRREQVAQDGPVFPFLPPGGNFDAVDDDLAIA